MVLLGSLSGRSAGGWSGCDARQLTKKSSKMCALDVVERRRRIRLVVAKHGARHARRLLERLERLGGAPLASVRVANWRCISARQVRPQVLLNSLTVSGSSLPSTAFVMLIASKVTLYASS